MIRLGKDDEVVHIAHLEEACARRKDFTYRALIYGIVGFSTETGKLLLRQPTGEIDRLADH